jgi:3-hydroxybutyryl-CoA dehydrogenase
LQSDRKVPARFVGVHWAQPAHITRFLELIRGEQTSDAAMEAASAIGQRLGKEPCLCQRDIPAFIVNRIAYSMYREALNLLELGVADAETIDTAVRNTMGLWASVCGPLRWIDVSGGPLLYGSTMERVLPTLSKASENTPTMQKLMDSGARGTANGRGFYQYTPEEAKKWETLLEEHVWRMGALHQEYFPMARPTAAPAKNNL